MDCNVSPAVTTTAIPVPSGTHYPPPIRLQAILVYRGGMYAIFWHDGVQRIVQVEREHLERFEAFAELIATVFGLEKIYRPPIRWADAVRLAFERGAAS